MVTTKQLVYAFFFSCIALFIVASFRGITTDKTEIAPSRTILSAPGISMAIASAPANHLTIRIAPQKKTSYFVTGWKLKNARGSEVLIGKASSLPKQGDINTEQPLLVPGGSTLLVSPKHSPIGVSFRVNACSGFLEQYQKISPPLDKNCPSANIILLPEEKYGLEQSCLTYIETLPSCHNPIKDPEINMLSTECKELLTTKVNYNTCTARLSTTDGFYKNEWRLFTGDNKNLWDGAFEILSLFDQDGRLLSTISY